MSLIKSLFPSMFHRRLLLLLAGMGVAVSLLGVQMARLAIGRGAESLSVAESKLVRRQMTPTVRGRILDRRGRVLAQDRPSYDVAVSFQVLDGRWAAERAQKFARRAFREQWPELTAGQRAELIGRASRAYAEHVEQGWELIARTAGMPVEEVRKARDEAIATVKRMHDSVSTRRRQTELQEFRARNQREPEGDELKTIERRANASLAGSRVILPRISDKLAFAFQSLVVDEVDLRPLGDEPGSRAEDPVERVPGLHVFDAGDRDYPMDTMMVEVDGRTLPLPLRVEHAEQVLVEGIGSQVIGWMRQVWVEDELARRELLARNRGIADRVVLELPDGESKDRGEYAEGDRVGQTGVEGAFETTLRGLRGMRTKSLDSDRVEEIAAEPGRDVKLSIDVMLQARVQGAMTPSLGLARVEEWHRAAIAQPNPTMPAGTPINGAAVVLDVDTGEILAMVSTPPVPARLRRDDPEAVFDDALNTPYLNRAINRPYPPGSIVKPLMLVESVKHGVYQLDQKIECTGYLIPNKPNMLQCWVWKQFKTTHNAILGHDLDGADAIMESCNIFFFTMGKRLGVAGVSGTFNDFGAGRTWDLGVGPENPGLIGRRAGGDPLQVGDAIQMGIGQGPVSWTPLHAACAYATLARGGVALSPSIVQNDPRGAGRAAGDRAELGLDPGATAMALEGLRRSVNDEMGAGHLLTYMRNGVRVTEPIFNTPGIRVIGKTGTAAAPDLKLRRDPGSDAVDEIGREDESDGMSPSEAHAKDPGGTEIVRSGDHSWFVVLAGREGDAPRYAIAVVMEYAGSGARVSGPIANQIVKALVEEGYLEPAPVAAAPAKVDGAGDGAEGQEGRR